MKTYLLIFILLFSACSTKEYKLFQKENPEHLSTVEDLNISYSVKIIPDDLLNIDIYNMNQKSNATLLGTNNASSEKDNSEFLVPDDGKIFLPLLGDVKVTGLTIKEMNQKLQQQYTQYLKKPYVKSKIKNHRVYVLGEIEKQGVVPIEGNSISVIEILSKSGGFTDHAIRNKLRIIYEEQGKFKMRTLDLTKFTTLNTKSLMVKHNSIVYVEPKGTKALAVNLNEYTPFMQAISSILNTFLIINYIK